MSDPDLAPGASGPQQTPRRSRSPAQSKSRTPSALPTRDETGAGAGVAGLSIGSLIAVVASALPEGV